VTTAETHRGTGISVHVVYPHLSYDIDRMQGYFTLFAKVWRSCFVFVHYQYTGERLKVLLDIPLGNQRSSDEPVMPRLQPPQLRVHRLSIGSPMEITFAVEGGAAVIAASTTFLFARVLRSPGEIGAWLPGLVAGWHRGWAEAETQKAARRSAHKSVGDDKDEATSEEPPGVRELVEAAHGMAMLRMEAEEVTTIGLDHLPDDLADPNAG
jgi:hypothetical protein